MNNLKTCTDTVARIDNNAYNVYNDGYQPSEYFQAA